MDSEGGTYQRKKSKKIAYKLFGNLKEGAKFPTSYTHVFISNMFCQTTVQQKVWTISNDNTMMFTQEA